MTRDTRKFSHPLVRGAGVVLALLAATASFAETTTLEYNRTGFWVSGALQSKAGKQDVTYQVYKGVTPAGRTEVFAKGYLNSAVFDPANPKPKTLGCRYYEQGGIEYLELYSDITAGTSTTTRNRFNFNNLKRVYLGNEITASDPDGNGVLHRRLWNVTSPTLSENPPLTRAAAPGDVNRGDWRTPVIQPVINSRDVRGDGNEGIYIERAQYRRTVNYSTQTTMVYRARVMRELHGVTHYWVSEWMSIADSAEFFRLLLAYQNASTARADLNAATRNIGLTAVAGTSAYFIADYFETGGSAQRWTEMGKPFASVLALSCTAAIFTQAGIIARATAQNTYVTARDALITFVAGRWSARYFETTNP